MEKNVQRGIEETVKEIGEREVKLVMEDEESKLKERKSLRENKHERG